MSFDSDRVTSGWPCACGIAPELNRARALKSLPSKANAHRAGVRAQVRPAGVRHPDPSVGVARAAPLESADAGHQWIAP
jgi:hypothetical protein